MSHPIRFAGVEKIDDANHPFMLHLITEYNQSLYIRLSPQSGFRVADLLSVLLQKEDA